MSIIAFCNLKGGVGKSTTAIALAYFLKFCLGKSVVVVDTDAQQSTAQWASFVGIDYESYTTDDIVNELVFLKADYEYVIIDAPSVILAVSVSIMERADWVFVPTKPNSLDLNSTGDILAQIERLQVQRSGALQVAVFLSMGKRNSLSVNEAQSFLSTSFPAFNLAETVIYDQACIGDSFGQQCTVWSMKPKTAAVKRAIAAYETLFTDVLGIPYAAEKPSRPRSLRKPQSAQTGGRGKAHAHAR